MSYPRLRKTVQQTWDTIKNNKSLELVSGISIKARYQAVIITKSMNMKYQIQNKALFIL